jgi:hypothetical protein
MTMETVTISRNELKKIMQETFIDVLTKRKDLIEDAVLDAIEDIGMGVAIEAGRTREYVNEKDFLRKLDSRIQRSK